MARTKNTKGEKEGMLTPAILAAGTAAALSAAASYFFYVSKNAAKNRKLVTIQAKNIRDEVMAQSKKLQKLDRKQVMAAIDAVAAGYERVRGIDVADVRAAARELKGNWKRIAAEVGKEIRRNSGETRPVKTPKKRRR